MARPHTKLNRLLAADRAAAELIVAPLEAEYEAALREASHKAVKRFRSGARHTIIAAGEGRPPHPGWTVPHADEILNSRELAADMQRRSEPLRRELYTAAAAGTIAGFGINMARVAPYLDGVIAKMGQKITNAAEDQRAAIMGELQKAWDAGLSIPHAAEAVAQESTIAGVSRATTIARTEFTAATNMASVQVASLVNAASPGVTIRKGWATAGDDRVRAWHEDAGSDYGDGNEIPVDQPFVVDGEPLNGPGDPDASPENSINCRCTSYFVQDASGMAVADRRWRGYLRRRAWRLGAALRV